MEQRFDRTGQRLGGELGINQSLSGDQAFPDVRISNLGGFLAVWSGPDGSDSGIFGRPFDANGVPMQGDFRANVYTVGFQGYPSQDG